ncbi:MAG: PIN domain-containing protein [Bacilli bacterium]|nr:PIN domain-containing protein [Bacilli bacterium]
MKLFVDTNIFLDFFLEREGCDDVERFFIDSRRCRNRLLVSAMSLRDIGYLVQKKTHDWRITRELQLKVYSIVYKVVHTTADAAIESLYDDWKDYEDCLQYNAAVENDCFAIITNDKTGFKDSPLPVYTPKEILEIMASYQQAAQ